MNVHLPVQMDKSTFLSWVQGREVRYELANGHDGLLLPRSP